MRRLRVTDSFSIDSAAWEVIDATEKSSAALGIQTGRKKGYARKTKPQQCARVHLTRKR
jgi:hypothetical protein